MLHLIRSQIFFLTTFILDIFPYLQQILLFFTFCKKCYSRMMKKIFRMMESFSYTMKKLTFCNAQIWRFFPIPPNKHIKVLPNEGPTQFWLERWYDWRNMSPQRRGWKNASIFQKCVGSELLKNNKNNKKRNKRNKNATCCISSGHKFFS